MEEICIRDLVVVGVISWSVGFVLIRKTFPNRSFEFSNRLVSTIHAIVAVTLASLSVQDWKCPLCPMASTSSPKQMRTLAISLSYLIYDLICCLFDKKISIDNSVHHLVSIIGIGAGLAYAKCGSEMVAALWLTEISSPFLHLREVLKELGYRNTDLNLVADISFAVIFTIARMVGGPYLAYVTLTSKNPLIIQVMAVGLQLKKKMEDQVKNVVMVGVISWSISFMLIRNILPNRSFGFCNRLVSSMHAILAVILASLSVEDWNCPVCPVASNSSSKQVTTLAVTLSYLIYDLICCQFDKQFSLDNTIHHLVSIVGIGAGLAYGKSGSELVAALWVSELSTPFLHLRELVKELGYKDTDLNLAADISFAVVFSVARMVLGSYVTCVTVVANNPLVIQAMAVGLLLLSAFWFFKIFDYFMKPYSG
ncbi:hypothetical protein F8388_014551 [Cannabis sativa]|uniref:TLC domain-containing protein n=1 Tax=Cannabis sativa TaxID=3483 RepID=A0A7J6EIS6_CANSA|nr:hypothetical protein F8388_014551 [Cannabis sativa]